MTPFAPERIDAWRALGVLLVSLFVTTALLYAPLLRPWWRTESSIWTLQNQIEDVRSIQSRAADIDAALNIARGQALAGGDYLSEPTAALGNVALTLRIQDAVAMGATDDSVCLLGNRVPVGSVDEGICEEARIRVDMQCGLESFENVLRTLETQPPRLRIDQMDVALAPNPLGFDKPSTGNEPLRISFEVAGCLLPGALAGDNVAGRAMP